MALLSAVTRQLTASLHFGRKFELTITRLLRVTE